MSHLNHTASYYAASCDIPDYPTLTDVIEADVCVVGAGFSGINTAIELAERGVSVVVLEAGKIGLCASGRNGGQLIQGFGHNVEQFKSTMGEDGIRSLKMMGIEAVDIVKQRILQHNIDCDLVWGYCDLANKASHMDGFVEHVDELHQLGYSNGVKLLDAEEIKTYVRSDVFVGGLLDLGSGHLHPLKLVLAEAKIAADLGVRVFEHSRAIELLTDEQRCVVRTEQGRVHCQRIVMACNAHIDGLEPTLDAKVLPAGSYIITTEPLEKSLKEKVVGQDLAFSDNQVGLNYFRITRDSRLLFGGACHYSGRDPKNIEAYMTPKMVSVFPVLANTRIDYSWGGMIGIGMNRLPQVGRLASRPQIYYAQAYSGHGVNASHMAARLVAEAMVGEGSPRFELLNKVAHRSFPGGKTFRSPLLALGMFWERMKQVV